MLVESIRLRLLLIGPLRLALSVVWLVAARVAGAGSGAVLIAFVAGAFGTAFLAFGDRRALFLPSSGTPEPLPADALVAPAWQHAFHAALPSTVGVSILAGIGLASSPTLTAVLAGVLAGLGGLALLHLPGADPGLYLDPRRRLLFRK